MRYLFGLLVAGVAFTALTFLSDRTTAAESESIESVMKKLYSKKGIFKTMKASVGEGGSDWAVYGKQSKDYVKLADALCKCKPELGTQASWDKLTKEHLDAAKALDQASTKKDLEAVKKALATLQDTCEACHENHR
ncbi:MAG: cytochrome c [Zavarzinella sp.]